VPEAVAVSRSHWRVQLIWLVPLVAVLIGGWLAVKAVLDQGPTITISFATGEGLEAGKTKIKFKHVDIGMVKSVSLSRDHRNFIASAELTKDASDLLVDDTRFWVGSSHPESLLDAHASRRQTFTLPFRRPWPVCSPLVTHLRTRRSTKCVHSLSTSLRGHPQWAQSCRSKARSSTAQRHA
jgi:hypothetical protein